MKNLENYGVQTLNAKEIKRIDGGFSPVFEWIVDEVIAWVEDGGIGTAFGDPNTPGMYTL